MSKIIAFDKSRRRFGATHSVQTAQADAAARADTRSVRPACRGALPLGAPAFAAAILVAGVDPTCIRPDLLRQCLCALLQQRFNFARYEIIVVDYAPCRATHDTVSELGASSPRTPAVVYIANPGPHGPATARNLGWREARGHLIDITDA